MCLILLALEPAPELRLVVAANRDEFYARPTAPARWWADAPALLAGRDLHAGGTWMGITRGGRFAAVTNYRETTAPRPDAPSRGELVAGFLLAGVPAAEWMERLEPRAGEYNGFNLLAGDGGSLLWLSNRGGAPRRLEPGVYGLSNALLDTAWPKVERGKAGMRAALAGPPDALERALFGVLADAEPAPDGLLPATGVGAERERALSSLFIRTPEYGTRSSTVLVVGADGQARFTERRLDPATGEWSESRFEFALEAGAGGSDE